MRKPVVAAISIALLASASAIALAGEGDKAPPAPGAAAASALPVPAAIPAPANSGAASTAPPLPGATPAPTSAAVDIAGAPGAARRPAGTGKARGGEPGIANTALDKSNGLIPELPVAQPENKAIAKYAAQIANQVYVLNLQARLLEAQLENAKKQVELAKLGVDSTGAPTGLAQKGRAGDNTSTSASGAAMQPNGALPPMHVQWIAGSSEALEAQVKINGYGNAVLKIGSLVPMTEDMKVEAISSDGLRIKDSIGRVYLIGVGSGT